MDYRVIELFKKRFEENAGRVIEVRNLDEVCGVIADILQTHSVSRVVLGDMPVEYSDIIKETLVGLGIEVITLSGEEVSGDIISVINSADAGVSMAEFGVADIGAIAEVTQDDKYRLVSSLPKIHITILKSSRVVESFEETAEELRRIIREKGVCVISFIGGPSRTGDVELTLVLGVHGPHKVYAILVGG